MQLPYFFEENIPSEGNFLLSEDTSRHVQVLRMQQGELIQLTNGRGDLFTASINKAHKKKRTEVTIVSKTFIPAPLKKISIAISPLKNSYRFEWFLEKATELGVSEIIPLLCNRTEKQHLKIERMQNIIVSAMLQSRQCWLPEFRKPVHFAALMKENFAGAKFIAHCIEADKAGLNDAERNLASATILVGPEGDFTEAEIKEAMENGYHPVSLGETRLRTETAGIVAAVLLINN